MLFRSLDFSLGKNHDDVFFSLSLSSFNRVQLTVYCCNKAISPHWFDFIVLTKLLQVRTINGHTWIGRKTRAFKALNLLWTNNTAENRKKRTQAMAVSGREREREKSAHPKAKHLNWECLCLSQRDLVPLYRFLIHYPCWSWTLFLPARNFFFCCSASIIIQISI